MGFLPGFMTKPGQNAAALTQAQAAALVGITTRRLRQIEQEEQGITRQLDASGRPGGYPPELFGAWMRAKWAADSGVSSSGTIYDEKIERARLLHHQANNESLKEKTNRGELIPAELVIDLGAALVAAARTRVLAIHSKVRGRFPELESAVLDEIETLTREALTELGSDGLHPDIRRRIAPAVRRLEAAAETDP